MVLATALAACGSALPSPSPSPVAPNRFHDAGLVFDYPAAWRAYHYEVVSSFSSSIVYLGTVEVQDPCIRQANGMTCGAGYQLEPGNVVLDLESAGFPTFNILERPQGARPIVVDGLPGYVEDGEPASGTGATAARAWSVPMPGVIDNYYRVTANARGPGDGALLDLVDGIVRGMRYDPPVPPLPDGRAAALATATAYLAASLRGADPSWACFPAEGSRTMEVSSLPNGPPLERARTATCTTAIAATPMRVWEMTLEMRLAEHDANGGWGTRITAYIRPDGEGVGGGRAEDLEAPAP